MSTCSSAVHEFSLKNLSILSGFFDSNNFPCIPVSQDQVKELVNVLDFPDRFFINLTVGRRLSSRITTRTGDCWFMSDALFSAVTLQKAGNNHLLSIIVSGNMHKYSNIEPVTKRYISSKTYHRHPLFPICLIADAALEDYRRFFNGILAKISNGGQVYTVDQHSMPILDLHNPAIGLAYVTAQRQLLNEVTSDLKAFHVSARDLLVFHRGRNVDPGSLQSHPGQSGTQAMPSPSLDSMLQYLVRTSEDSLDKMTSADTRLQHLFLAVRVCDGRN